MPVYAIIPTGIASAKFDQVGATPQWTLSPSTSMLKIRKKPSRTSKSCVAKSITASRMFSFAAS